MKAPNIDHIFLVFKEIARIHEGTRSTDDQRKRVDDTVVTYVCSQGFEYRKHFETPCGTPATIPLSGTSGELNALKYQFTPTLSEAIAVALTGTSDPVCVQCGEPAFASVGGRLLCRNCY